MIRSVLLGISLLSLVQMRAQVSTPVKFGRISKEDISQTRYQLDTNAAAVVLAETGSTRIIGDGKGWLLLEFKVFRRIHILNNNGFDKSIVEIPLYTEFEKEEKLDDLRASTYNLEEGRVVESKLDVRTSVFTTKQNKNSLLKKFTLPNVKAGSVIEYSYTIRSGFLFNLQPWDFQDDSPKLSTTYSVMIPDFMNYAIITQGNLPLSPVLTYSNGSYSILSSLALATRSLIGSRYSIDCAIAHYSWELKNVPPFHEEVFSGSSLNHISRVDFQLAGYSLFDETQSYLTTWKDLSFQFLSRSDFGAELSTAANWWPQELEAKVRSVKGELATAKIIYEYVKNSFSCTDTVQLFTDHPLQAVMESKRGGVAEINLLLTALFRYAGLDATPVILSTKGNRFVNDKYPEASRFNYVICRVFADGTDFLVDATHPMLDFGRLSYACYNGSARDIDSSASRIQLTSDMIQEESGIKCDFYQMNNGRWKGEVKQLFGVYDAERIRMKLKTGQKNELLAEIRNQYPAEWVIDSVGISNLSELALPLEIHYSFQVDGAAGQLFYLNPVIPVAKIDNPFKQIKRDLPVEMDYKIVQEYVMRITVPDDYVADELPVSFRSGMKEYDSVYFNYEISITGNIISVKYRFNVGKTFFAPASYAALRSFYSEMVAHLESQIVLKKK